MQCFAHDNKDTYRGSRPTLVGHVMSSLTCFLKSVLVASFRLNLSHCSDWPRRGVVSAASSLKSSVHDMPKVTDA